MNQDLLVSCITVTTKKRKEFFPQLLRCWWEQTYLNTELVIVSEDDMSDVIPNHPRIRFIPCAPGTSLGQKRNIACEASRGAIIAQFDDDDWSSPQRVEECVEALVTKKVFVTGYRVARFYETDTKIARIWDGGPNWIQGSSLCFIKSHWQGNKFPDVASGEDLSFLQNAGLIFTMNGINRMVFRDHSDNTWPRKIHYGKEWKVIDSNSTQKLLYSQEKTKVTLSMLTWNDKEKTLENLNALKAEAENLRKFNFDPCIVVCDNGSIDGTKLALKKVKGIHVINNKANLGIAPAKNKIIDYAIDNDSEFVLFTDCDITVVPFSVLEMLRWLRPRASQAACVGTNWYKCTEDPNLAARWCPTIMDAAIFPHQAPAHYGLFFTNILNRYRFDNHFGPGWGAEDNDLAMSIEDETYLKMYVFPLIHVHQHPHKSIELLKTDGINPENDIRERYSHMIEKWKDKPEFAQFINWLINAKESNKNLLPS